MSSQDNPTTAFVLSLIGGLLMLVGGGVSSMWFMGGTGIWGCRGMIGGYQGMMGSWGVPLGFMGGLSLIGVISGILVIIGAIMLNTRPKEHTAWGTIILIFSIISFLGMGGFFIGAILGIIGGALAISLRTTSTA